MEFTLTTPGVDLEGLTAQAAKALRREQQKLGRDIAKAGRRAVLTDVKSSRGSLRFGTNRKTGGRYRLGIKTKVEPGAQLSVTLSGDPAGFWAMIEYGTKAHDIYPRKGREGRNGRPAALSLVEGADFYAANVWHPGTTARPAWFAAETALDKAVTPVIQEAFDDVMEELG